MWKTHHLIQQFMWMCGLFVYSAALGQFVPWCRVAWCTQILIYWLINWYYVCYCSLPWEYFCAIVCMYARACLCTCIIQFYKICWKLIMLYQNVYLSGRKHAPDLEGMNKLCVNSIRGFAVIAVLIKLLGTASRLNTRQWYVSHTYNWLYLHRVTPGTSSWRFLASSQARHEGSALRVSLL